MTTVAQHPSTVEYLETLRQALQRDTTLRQLAAQARTRYAGEQGRIDRGLGIALNGGVTLHADGSADVQSASDPEIVYHVAHGTCDCPDFQRAPDGRCKHRFSVCLVKKARKITEYYTTNTESQGLVMGGHRQTADTKRAEEEAAGGFVALICGYGK